MRDIRFMYHTADEEGGEGGEPEEGEEEEEGDCMSEEEERIDLFEAIDKGDLELLQVSTGTQMIAYGETQLLTVGTVALTLRFMAIFEHVYVLHATWCCRTAWTRERTRKRPMPRASPHCESLTTTAQTTGWACFWLLLGQVCMGKEDKRACYTCGLL